jgi:hypothetical protein
MAEQPRSQTASGQHAAHAGDGASDVAESQRTPGKAEGEDPHDPASKPQGTLEDQETNMDSEGHLVEPPSAESG